MSRCTYFLDCHGAYVPAYDEKYRHHEPLQERGDPDEG